MITQMPFALNRVVNLEDFQEPVVRDAIREIYARESGESPEFPSGREHRKQWEVAMAALALEDGAVLRPDAEVLGIGAGSEATLFWLTNYVRRVWATDLYADPGEWVDTAPPTMLTNPGSAWDGPWNPRRLVVQHMDACELHYEDETFDGIFSSGSIEHFGSLERIGIAMDEAFRVLKRGGTASFSTEFLIDGDPLAFESTPYVSPPSSSSACFSETASGFLRRRSNIGSLRRRLPPRLRARSTPPVRREASRYTRIVRCASGPM